MCLLHKELNKRFKKAVMKVLEDIKNESIKQKIKLIESTRAYKLIGKLPHCL